MNSDPNFCTMKMALYFTCKLVCMLNISASTGERLEDYLALHAEALKFCSLTDAKPQPNL